MICSALVMSRVRLAVFIKKLVLENPSYRYLENSFKEWLDILGYAPTSVYYMPIHVRELLYYLENEGINNIREMDNKHILAHYEKLKERANARRAGGISNNHLNKHIQALRKFTDYLRQVGRLDLPALPDIVDPLIFQVVKQLPYMDGHVIN